MTDASVAAQLSPIPVVLRSSVTLPRGAGTTVPSVFDTTRFQNTLRVPIEITEFLIVVSQAPASSSAEIDAGSAVELELRVKDRHMTNGYVPFRTLAPWSPEDDEAWVSSTIDSAAHVASFNQRRVYLRTPLRLLPGVGFSGSARRAFPDKIAGPATTIDEVVSIAAIGRVVPDGIRVPTPQRIPLWTAAQIVTTTALPVGSSSELELLNPLSTDFDSDMVVVATDPAGPLQIGAGGAIPFDPRISLRWPNGDLLGPDTPPMLQTLAAHDNALRGRIVVPPRARVHAVVDSTDLTLSAFGGEFLVTRIAMFGSRSEVL